MAREMPKAAGYHWDVNLPVMGSNGRPSCRWCKGDVNPPKHSWCGKKECVTEWTRRKCWAITRDIVFRRDKGTCQICGLKPELIRAEYRDMLRYRYEGRRITEKMMLAAPETEMVAKIIRYPVKHLVSDHSWWEVDHIQPVSEGGDWFDLENLRILCVACHAEVTRLLVAHQSNRRRSKKLETKC